MISKDAKEMLYIEIFFISYYLLSFLNNLGIYLAVLLYLRPFIISKKKNILENVTDFTK